jgi:glycosyltransferase involved in cell wall biosynthesis
MAANLFTVLLPVHRPPALLPFAAASVLAQSETRFRLCILCDGAPPQTVEFARVLAARDSRVEVFAFEKGERHGEAHRHTILTGADSDFVAQIGDDDLWLPDYLAEMARLLETADFGNLPQVSIRKDGMIHVASASLGDAQVRERMMTQRWNLFGPSFAGYRLAAYRRLPVGWSPAPPGIWSDLHMWRKFLAMREFRFETRFSFEAVKFAAESRTSMTLARRAEEIRWYAERFAVPADLRWFRAKARKTLAVQRSMAGHAE